jgi:hypothetical protein
VTTGTTDDFGVSFVRPEAAVGVVRLLGLTGACFTGRIISRIDADTFSMSAENVRHRFSKRVKVYVARVHKYVTN